MNAVTWGGRHKREESASFDTVKTNSDVRVLTWHRSDIAINGALNSMAVPLLQVGMLGANAPAMTKATWNIRIAGKVVFPIKPKWGHMISSHYLQFLKKGDYPDSKLHHYMKKVVASEKQ